MQNRFVAMVLGLVVMTTVSLEAAGQSVEAARAARDRAKADLIKAQEAFDRADDAYINALRGTPVKAAGTSSVPPAAEFPRNSVVVFGLSGPKELDANMFDYRGRLIMDDQPGEWTQHASGTKYPVPDGTRTLAYEVQTNASKDPTNPAWKTICQGNLPRRKETNVDIVIGQKTACTAK
jgi:hypothetical protein